MIGLAGAHRVGKTTLAKAYAEKHGWTFAESSVTSIFKSLGHDPAEKFDFQTRLTIQEQILIRMNRFYREVEGANVITDRTPLDMLMYTMAEAVGDAVHPEDQARFKRYVHDCYEVTNRWFSSVLVVQPGIALVAEEGKAVLNEPYIEHLNSLVIGISCDERLKVPHFYIPRDRIELERRLSSVERTVDQSLEAVIRQANTMPSSLMH